MTPRFTCPVCGYPNLTENPTPPGGGGSYEICYSCGFEFGVTDLDKGFTFDNWRELWIKEGMTWGGKGIDAPPKDWDPVSQLDNLTATDGDQI